MGLFSIYTGIIYNDVFSKSMNIFGTSWNVTYTDAGLNYTQRMALGLDNNTHTISKVSDGIYSVPVEAFSRNNPYPFGIDPIWQVAGNKLLILNSFKMKMSIILGVVHMMFGIVLSAFNYVHFKEYYKIFFQLIPEMLFLSSIFGYLVFLIFFKWVRYYVNKQEQPRLLIVLISMFLSFGKTPTVEEGTVVFDAELQSYLQILLVLVALISVPWLLIPSPLYLIIKNKLAKRNRANYQRIEDDEEATANGELSGDAAAAQDDDQLEVGEVVVHRVIHTIEFCLGCISNTASYLRLWALSLAHAQLSEVLWQQILQRALMMQPLYFSIPFIFIGFSVWAVATIAVLLVMEGLSAFLHALRLHWVEFQNKFYVGDGYSFTPFSFTTILTGEGEE
ncbi:V-type proton ATPase [Oopsacas minuta]|uniref:V-type proton ATPase subunit a n=1 Tax=Oopsacas minuta TaxID=111878 RepID=A0AAV7JB21_9METZ|nr:V-type proton ATPase [Oopsacas minuta]